MEESLGRVCKAVASEAHVYQACHRWNELVLSRFAYFMCMVQLFGRAIVDVWTVSLHDRSLETGEKQILLSHASRAHTGTDLEPIVIGSISIKVPAMSILPWHCWHCDLGVDVIAFRTFGPPIDLDIHATRQG